MIDSLLTHIQDLDFQAPLPTSLVQGYQTFPGVPIESIGREVQAALGTSHLLESVQPGQSVAIGVGSRGLANLPALTRAIVEAVRTRQAHPFIVPAMGSHGGGTTTGQRQVLAQLGVTCDTVGTEIRAAMEVKCTGCLPEGLALYQGLDSAQADHTLLLGRVKPHTSFHSNIESGLAKMSVIGLGKMVGAQTFHSFGVQGFVSLLTPATRMQVARTNILGGIAVVENAREETIAIAALAADEFAGPREEALLELARDHMPRIPVSPIDVLVVRQLGKNISGTGMDTNVIGRYGVPDQPDADWPRITVVAVLSLTPDTKGNANGLGLANVIPARVLQDVNWQITYTNSLTAGVMGLRKAALPVVMPSDRQALELALRCIQRPPEQARILMIEDTLSLSHAWMTQNLATEWECQPESSLGTCVPLSFDEAGTMITPWSLT